MRERHGLIRLKGKTLGLTFLLKPQPVQRGDSARAPTRNSVGLHTKEARNSCRAAQPVDHIRITHGAILSPLAIKRKPYRVGLPMGVNIVLMIPRGDTPHAIGQRIRIVRQAYKLSQEQLASRLGVSQNALSGWETGKNEPPSDVRKTFMREFHVDHNWFYDGDPGGLPKRLYDLIFFPHGPAPGDIKPASSA